MSMTNLQYVEDRIHQNLIEASSSHELFLSVALAPKPVHLAAKYEAPHDINSTFLCVPIILAAPPPKHFNLAVGSACNQTVYLRRDSPGKVGTIEALTPRGDGDSLSFPSEGAGNAYKLDYDPTMKNPIEFDWSMDTTGLWPVIYFVVSDQNGHLFDLIAGNIGCPIVSCPGEGCNEVQSCGPTFGIGIMACRH